MSAVPVIDIAPFRHGTASDRNTVAAQVDAACRDIGFLVIEGHGVPSYKTRAMYACAAAYFARPHWEKMRLRMPPDRYRGYTPAGEETLALSLGEETPPDLKESFSMGPFDHAYDEYHFGAEGYRYFAPNVWPLKPRTMQATWEAYYALMEGLASQLMRIFAVALDVPQTWFDDKIDRHITNLSVIHYPAQNATPRPGQLRAGAHTDYGSLTIVHTDTAVGGLEVQDKSGAWLPVPVSPRTFVVNIGDLMAEWTNDRWVSTMHRVANPPRGAASAKTSLLFFHQPNYDAVVECIPTCTEPGRPPRYKRTTSGEHVTAKITSHRTL